MVVARYFIVVDSFDFLACTVSESTVAFSISILACARVMFLVNLVEACFPAILEDLILVVI